MKAGFVFKPLRGTQYKENDKNSQSQQQSSHYHQKKAHFNNPPGPRQQA